MGINGLESEYLFDSMEGVLNSRQIRLFGICITPFWISGN
jgi:hypothetical protein